MFNRNKTKKEKNIKWYTDEKSNTEKSISNNWYEECKQIAEKQEQKFLKAKKFCDKKELEKNKEVWTEINLNDKSKTGFENPNYKGYKKPSSSQM